MILILFLSITFVFIILTSLFVRTEYKKASFPKTLGETQINTLETYQEAEKALFFIDQSAKLSAEQAIYDLGQSGGFKEISSCGEYYNYALWNNEGNIECYPETKSALSHFTDTYLNNYLTKYSAQIIPQNNYDYLIKESNDITTIYGFATRNLELELAGGIGKHATKPSFKIDINYNVLDDYAYLEEKAAILLGECPYEADITGCANSKISTFNNENPDLILSLGPCEQEENPPYNSIADHTFKFCATPQKQFYTYNPAIDPEKPTLQNPEIRFALYMEDLPPPPIKNLLTQDKPNSDKTIILKWGKSMAPDVTKYNLYSSKEDFFNWEIKDNKIIDNSKQIIPVTINTDTEHKLKSLDITSAECDFDNTEKECTFKFSVINQDSAPASIELKNNEPYYISDEEKYIYLLPIEDNEQYNFAITAIDIADNEIDNINEKWKLTQGKNYNQGSSEDKLAPGIIEPNAEIKTKATIKVIELTWAKPLNNIDGTPNTEDDIASYNIYYETTSFDSITADLVLRLTSTTTLKDINLNSLEKDTTYYFAVTAVDQNNNEFKEHIITRSIKTPE